MKVKLLTAESTVIHTKQALAAMYWRLDRPGL